VLIFHVSAVTSSSTTTTEKPRLAGFAEAKKKFESGSTSTTVVSPRTGEYCSQSNTVKTKLKF